MNILYTIGKSLYVNVTNKCSCNCVFCIRRDYDGIDDSGSLWLERDPKSEEIINEFKKIKLDDFNEVVFCGYGEPLIKLNEVIEVSNYIKTISNIPIRVNSNGLADLYHKKDVAPLLKGVIDSISISLNAPSNEEYLEVAKPIFGLESFDALLKFAKEAKENINEVQFSVVDVITKEQIERCKKISKDMGIPLRVRNKQ